MTAVVYDGPRQVSVKDVPDARLERPTDVLVRITTTNICGSDELPLDQAPEAYKHFDARDDGWTKVVLKPATPGA